MLDYKESNENQSKRKNILFSSFIVEFAKLVFGSVFLVSVVFVLTYGYRQFSNKFAILKKVYVVGNRVLPASYVVKNGIGEFGKSMDSYKLRLIYMNLISNPWVRSVKVAKVYPDTIIIKLKEKIPKALIYSSKGVFVIDSNGYVISKYEKELRLPSSMFKIKVKRGNFLKNKDLIMSVIAFYEKLDKIIKINYIEVVSDSYQIAYSADGLKIGIDSLDCPPNSLNRLKESLPYLLSFKNKIESVNICFNNKIVVKRKKGVKK